MKKNNVPAFLEVPTRQSWVAIILILLKFVRIMFRQLWPILLIFVFNPSKKSDSIFTEVILGIALFIALGSIIAYFKFYFYVENDELVIEKGVIRKTKLNVPIGRIQTVNFKQGILHQIFGVVSVEIDTAGSSGSEFSINAVSKKQAEAIRRYVQLQKKENVNTDNDLAEIETATLPNQTLLLHLHPLDLVKIGVSQNHLRTAGIIMAFFYGFFDDIEQALGLDLFKDIDKWAANNGWAFYLLLGIPMFLGLSFIFTLIRTVLRHFDLKFWKTAQGFKMESGLLTRHENSANLQKIQLLRWSSTPVKRLFGLFSVVLSQAATMAIGRRQSLFVPGCYEPQVTAIRAAYWAEEADLSFKEHRISKLICWRQVLYLGILPTGLLIFWTFQLWAWVSLFWLLLIPTVYFWSLRYHFNWRFHVSEEGLRTSSGVFTHQKVLLQWYKVQAVEIRQSIYQRRKSVANLIFHTAAGSVSIPYVALETAQAIQNFVLYRVEIDGRDWM